MSQICQEAKSICTEEHLQTKVKKQATFLYHLLTVEFDIPGKTKFLASALRNFHGGIGGCVRLVGKEAILLVIFVCLMLCLLNNTVQCNRTWENGIITSS